MSGESAAAATAPMRGREAWRRTHEVRERFLAAGDPDRLPPEDCGVRREIVLSWRRSLLSGVDAASTDLPCDDRAVPPERLVRAAGPVVDRLADQLAGMRAWAFLADHECRLVRHVVGQPALVSELEARGAFPGARFAEDVVGTNGLGTAVEQRRAARGRRLTQLERAEREVLVTALRDAAWDREAAARELGISRATIYRKLKRFGIRPPALRGPGRAGTVG